jgi:hypothetical protein
MIIRLMLLIVVSSIVTSAFMCVLKSSGLLSCTWFWALLPAGLAVALALALIVPAVVALRVMLHEGRNIP